MKTDVVTVFFGRATKRFAWVRKLSDAEFLFGVCAAIVGIKLCVFLADPSPQFFQGDSFSYMATAISGWIPPDRSYSYGYAIRWLTCQSHSLTSLVFAQVLASIGVAILSYHISRKRFRAPFALAAAAAICCALDPMQLFYERVVMTETFSSFLFILCLDLSLAYSQKPRFMILFVVALLGTLLISLKTAFLPSAFVFALLPPLLRVVRRGRIPKQPLSEEIAPQSRWMTERKVCAAHAIACLLCVAAMHYGYRHLTGYMAGREPAYVHADGLFMLAGVSPFVIPKDATDSRVEKVIAENAEHQPPDLRLLRSFNRFAAEGLVGRLEKAIPDARECNYLAKKAAINALLRAPGEAFFTCVKTYADYFDNSMLKKRVLHSQGGNNQGGNRDLNEEQRSLIRDNYYLAVTADWGALPTLTKRYQLKCRFWQLVLVLGPLLALLALLTTLNGDWRCMLIMTCAVLATLPGICLFSIPVFRYFHASGFVVPIVLATMTHQIGIRFMALRRLKSETG